MQLTFGNVCHENIMRSTHAIIIRSALFRILWCLCSEYLQSMTETNLVEGCNLLSIVLKALPKIVLKNMVWVWLTSIGSEKEEMQNRGSIHLVECSGKCEIKCGQMHLANYEQMQTKESKSTANAYVVQMRANDAQMRVNVVSKMPKKY